MIIRMARDKGKILYLGLDPSRFDRKEKILHFPLIKIVPFSLQKLASTLTSLDLYSNLLFTSRQAVIVFTDLCKEAGIQDPWKGKQTIAVGKATAALLPQVDFIAKEETGEGVVSLLSCHLEEWKGGIFFPHSAKARPLIREFLQQTKIPHQACAIYDTHFQLPTTIPVWDEIEEIVFTSPSTVEAFFTLLGPPPQKILLTTLGPVTQKVLANFLKIPYGGTSLLDEGV